MSSDDLRRYAVTGTFPGPSKTFMVEPIKVPRTPVAPTVAPVPLPETEQNGIAARAGPGFVNAGPRGAGDRSGLRRSDRRLVGIGGWRTGACDRCTAGYPVATLRCVPVASWVAAIATTRR